MGVGDDRERERGDDTEVEVFERIPWESLERAGGDRRWIAYLVTGVLVLGAVGVSLGRQITPVSTSVDSTVPPAVASSQPVAGPPAGGVSLPPAGTTTVPETGLWSEADLMALADAPVEVTAASVAEWFIRDHFTRDGDDGERSFVEWVGTVGFTWTDPARAAVTVALVRLASEGEAEYRRLDPEGWEVHLELDEEGWMVVDGPFMAEGGRPRVVMSAPGSTETAESEWIDGAGLTWTVRERSDEAS